MRTREASAAAVDERRVVEILRWLASAPRVVQSSVRPQYLEFSLGFENGSRLVSGRGYDGECFIMMRTVRVG